METFSLEIERRSDLGRSAANRLRSMGKLPVVVYGRGEDSISGVVDYNKFVQLAHKAATSQVFTFKSADSALNNRIALVKEIQKEYVQNRVLHVDFQALKEDAAVRVHVPVVTVGEAPGVKIENGVMTLAFHDLLIEALPRAIPHVIEIDVSDLHLNQSIHAGEITLPEGVRYLGDPDEAVVSVVESRTSKLAEETAAPAEAVTEEAAAGAEAAADAAAGKEKAGKEKGGKE